MSEHPFRVGEFVWCNFPEDEQPVVPGPPHVAYVVSGIATYPDYGAVVAYTTSRLWEGRTPRGVRNFGRAEAEEMGQRRPFTLDLRRLAVLPVTEAWFPYLHNPDRGRLGRATKKLRAELQTELSELGRRSPEVIRRLGPGTRS